MDKYVRFPQTIKEIEQLCKDFQKINDFPGCFALVDGSHVPLAALKGAIKHAFMNRNKIHSITIHMFGDAH